ncbi:MAG: hypothetical protein CMB06_02145 [Euryarchaeota archaeon]|mgnify:FL=1|nr:hypothetical protein [Euryarchaeota archaeon]
MAPPLNIVLVNSKSSERFNEEHRRLITKFSPVCHAYNFHLVLVNFKINLSPLDFAREMASSTSIGNSGETLVELAKKGKLKITKLPLKNDLGKTIICTSEPDGLKIKNAEEIASLLKKETVALIFGCDRKHNKNIRNLIKSSNYHLDISNNGIKLSLDTELGAITTLIKNLK